MKNAKQSLFKKNWVAKVKKLTIFGLYTSCYLSVFILAYVAKPGDFTEIAYFQQTKKKKMICV